MNIDDMSKRLKSLERKVNQQDERSIFCSPNFTACPFLRLRQAVLLFAVSYILTGKSILTTNTHTLQIEEILELLPHRFPFLLVDRVLDFEEGRFLRAVKNVSVNEPFFQGHFPGKPIFPGVLILEAMAQATGILAFKSVGKLEPGELYYFAGIDEARFKRPVVPGDQMIMEVTFEKTRRGLTRFKGVALVHGKVVCEATMMCARSREA